MSMCKDYEPAQSKPSNKAKEKITPTNMNTQLK